MIFSPRGRPARFRALPAATAAVATAAAATGVTSRLRYPYRGTAYALSAIRHSPESRGERIVNRRLAARLGMQSPVGT